MSFQYTDLDSSLKQSSSYTYGELCIYILHRANSLARKYAQEEHNESTNLMSAPRSQRTLCSEDQALINTSGTCATLCWVSISVNVFHPELYFKACHTRPGQKSFPERLRQSGTGRRTTIQKKSLEGNEMACFDKRWIAVRILIIKTGTNRLPFITNPANGLHIRDNRVTKL